MHRRDVTGKNALNLVVDVHWRVDLHCNVVPRILGLGGHGVPDKNVRTRPSIFWITTSKNARTHFIMTRGGGSKNAATPRVADSVHGAHERRVADLLLEVLEDVGEVPIATDVHGWKGRG